MPYYIPSPWFIFIYGGLRQWARASLVATLHLRYWLLTLYSSTENVILYIEMGFGWAVSQIFLNLSRLRIRRRCQNYSQSKTWLAILFFDQRNTLESSTPNVLGFINIRTWTVVNDVPAGSVRLVAVGRIFGWNPYSSKGWKNVEISEKLEWPSDSKEVVFCGVLCTPNNMETRVTALLRKAFWIPRALPGPTAVL